MRAARSLVLLVVLALGVALVPAGAVDRPSTSGGVVPGRLLVGLRDGVPAQALDAEAGRAGARRVAELPQIHVAVLDVPVHRAAALADRLRAAPGVRFVEREHVVRAHRAPNDALFAHQWGAQRVGGPQAWDVSVGSPEVVIAVLDTGVAAEHEDLRGAVLPGVDLVNGGTDPRDDSGHGTSATGVAAARADNRVGVAGMCWRCSILPIKVLNREGVGFTSAIAAGFIHAADQGADVLNASFGQAERSNTLAAAVTYAHQRDVVMVAAVGNAGSTTPTYPAGYEAVIGVAGALQDDTRPASSNHGPWVTLAAPWCNPTTSWTASDAYSWFCGTSSSAPLVAGAAALARAAFPAATNTQVEAALRQAAVPVGGWVQAGRLDVPATLAALAAGVSVPGSGLEPIGVHPEPIQHGAEEPLEPDPGTRSVRVAGSDRFATAAALSRATFAAGVDRAYVATGLDFPDALAAGAAAAAARGPVLLTAPHSVPAPTEEELRRLAPREVVVVGGAGAVSDTVVAHLRAVTGAPVRRVAGATRFSTAATLAIDGFSAPAPAVYVATGADFPDALAGVPAAGRDGAPLLLVTRDGVPAQSEEALRALQPRRVVVLGGSAVVTEAVVARLRELTGAPVVRLSGSDRFATAAAVAATFPRGGPVVYLATGLAFPDALAGGPAAAQREAPLLLVVRDAVPTATAEALRGLAPDELVVLGGTGVISVATEQAAAQAAAQGQPQ